MRLKDILLREVGGGSSGVYETKRVQEKQVNFAYHIKEEFETENEEYIIDIIPTYFDLESKEQKKISLPGVINVFKVSFEVKGESLGSVVGVENPLKVINTVVRTVFKIFKEFEEKTRGFIFEGSGNPTRSSKREKVYKRFIREQFGNLRFIKSKDGQLVVLIGDDK